MHEQEDAESEESIESISLEECNSRDHYNNRQQYNVSRQWIAIFQELKLYKAKHGHCNVPQRTGRLGAWVHNQRRQYRLLQEGKRSSMTDERIQKLESIGFQWSLRGTPKGSWGTMLDELKSFKDKHGHCNVPQRTGRLGAWVNYQRQQYRLLQEGKQSGMTDERIQKLESIGFQWSLRRSENEPDVQAAVLVGGATDMETVSTSTPDDAHHGATGASFHDHITNLDCRLNDFHDISCDEPDVVTSSEAASKVVSEFRPFLLGGGYC